MNGYKIISDNYKELMKEGKVEKEMGEKAIRIYDFLADCDNDDLYLMVDSSAFNEIIKKMTEMAAINAGLDDVTIDDILSELRWLFDEKNAKEILGE